MKVHEYLGVAGCRIGIYRHPMHVRQAYRILHDQVDAPPEAGAHESRHNVPAIAVTRLPDPHRLGVMAETGYPYHMLLGFLDCGTDYHLHQIVTCPRLARDVETMRDHGVVGVAQMLPIQPDVRDAVYPFEVQHQPLSVLQRRDIEMAAVHPLVSLPLAELVYVVADFGILHEPGCHQVKFHVAGNGCGNLCLRQSGHLRRIRDSCVFLLPIFKVPLAIEGNNILGIGWKEGRNGYGGAQEGCQVLHISSVLTLTNIHKNYCLLITFPLRALPFWVYL